MSNYAFIDFQNTDSTTKKLLGFSIDWIKLFEFLKNNWKCVKVFLYIGVDEGDLDTATMLEELQKKGCIVRAKTVFAYKNKDKELNILCPQCGHKFIERIDMGYNRKSNCDVDLTVDAMDLARPEAVFYLFTGDGDFEFLVRNANSKGSKVHIVSSSKKIKSGPNYFTSRLSTKLRKIFAENSDKTDFINIDNLKNQIQKL